MSCTKMTRSARYALVAALLVLFASSAVAQEPKISPACKETENGIRELWNATIWDPTLRRVRDGADHVRVVSDLVRSAERLCQEFRDRKPRQLPEELRKLAR